MKISLLYIASALGLAAGMGGCATSGTESANSQQLDVGVRSQVPDKTYLWSKQPGKVPGDGGHSKVYGILGIYEIKSERKLTKPVDQAAVVSLLMNLLDAHGFREFTKGTRPDILLTVSYGRGLLNNPYIRDTGAVGGSGNGAPNPEIRPDAKYGDVAGEHPTTVMGSYTTDNAPPGVTITGAMALQLFDERAHGYEAKLQKASFEKLYIRVTAWKYPRAEDDPAPLMLWNVTMVLDDPDHRDLNSVAESMLTAGAPYFDKEINEPERDVYLPLPTTHVTVGPTQVREPFNPKSAD